MHLPGLLVATAAFRAIEVIFAAAATLSLIRPEPVASVGSRSGRHEYYIARWCRPAETAS